MRLVPFLLLLISAAAARADEGMWTFDNFPAAKMRVAHRWAPNEGWLDAVRLAAVTLTGGCSGSLVPSRGLVLTNHHCVAVGQFGGGLDRRGAGGARQDLPRRRAAEGTRGRVAGGRTNSDSPETET